MEDDNDKTTGSLSWAVQIQRYIQGQDTSDPSLLRQRKSLLDALQHNPSSPEPWAEFLLHEERIAQSSDACAGARVKGGVCLAQLYQRATELVPRARGQAPEAYMRLWIGHARHQWQRSQDEGRDLFKALKNQHIGDTCAVMYREWAQLEAASGNASKAVAILQKGIKERAEPRSALESLLGELQPGWAEGAEPPRRVHFKETDINEDGAADTKRRNSGSGNPNTPGAEPKQFVGAYAPAPYTSLSLGSTSSKSSASHLQADLSLGLSSHMMTKSQATTQSQGSEDDTISCRSGEEKTQGSYRGGGGSNGGGGNTGTVTLPAGGLGGTLNIAAGAAAVAALTGGPGSSSQGGNNTGNMSLGLKRFGLRSKAVRVTSAGQQAVGASPPQEQQGPMPAASAQQEGGTDSQQDADSKAQAMEMSPGPKQPLELHAAAAEPYGEAMDVDVGSSQPAEDAQRKRKPDAPPRQSPAHALQAQAAADGPKRRQSPDPVPLRMPGLHGAGGQQGTVPSVGAPAAAPVPHSAPSDAQHMLPAPYAAGLHTASLPAAPMPTAAEVPGQQPSVRPVLDPENIPPAAGSYQESAHKPVSAAVSQAGAAANLPAGQAGACRPADENQAPQHATPAEAGKQQGDRQRPQAQPVPESREPLRPVGARGPSGGAAVAQRPQRPAEVVAQPPAVPQPQPPAAPQPQPPQQGVFNWPERLEQPQARPIENEMFVYVHAIRYQKLDLAGKGGSSKVYKVLGLNRGIYALKRVRFHNKDPEAVRGFIDEIALLRQLRGKPNIIQLIDAQVFREDGLVYMVLEYGDVDLAHLLHSHVEARRRNAAGTAGGDGTEASDAAAAAANNNPSPDGAAEIDTNFIRLYWQQMLQAVRCIHELRIVHADLKPANFMLVQGQLKLIDFGIAKAIQGDTTSINRESQVGTLNYMSPEAIQGGSQNPLGGPPLKVGRPSDVWSLGCILYQMIYGRTPFADLPFIPKMNAICNPAYEVPFPPCSESDAVKAIARCLDRNPKTRATLQELLEHDFLHPNRHKQQAQPLAAPAPAAAGPLPLTQDQIRAILQIGVAGAGGTTDLDSLALKVMQQLAGGDAGAAIGAAAAAAPGGAAQAGLAVQQGGPPTAAPSSGTVPAPAAQAPRAPPPPPGPPPPPLMAFGARAAPPPPPPGPPPPPPIATAARAGSLALQPPPLAPMQAIAVPASAGAPASGLGDIAAMAAATAAKRANRLMADPDQLRASQRPQQPAPHLRPPGGIGALPLAGAELHAAILQQRTQLRPVEQQLPQLAQAGGGGADDAGRGGGAGRAGGGAAGAAGADGGLEAVLRRGLERFHFADSSQSTHGNTEFIEAALARQS